MSFYIKPTQIKIITHNNLQYWKYIVQKLRILSDTLKIAITLTSKEGWTFWLQSQRGNFQSGQPRDLRSRVKGGDGRPRLLVPNSPHGLYGSKATLNLHLDTRAQELCESRDGRVLGPPSEIVLLVSVDVKQHWTWTDRPYWSLVVTVCSNVGCDGSLTGCSGGRVAAYSTPASTCVGCVVAEAREVL